jgi:hypothetical protein
MNQEIDNIGAAIVKGVCNPEAKDLAVDLGEFELGALLDESILQETPIIKSVIACHKTWEAVHDRLFLRKVAMFLSSSPKFTHEQKEKFIQEHLHDLKEAKQLSAISQSCPNRAGWPEKRVRHSPYYWSQLRSY